MNNKPYRDSEQPTPGQQVISATAFLHHKFGDVEKVFLAKRSADRKFLPDIFEMPGGHIDYGEDIVAGLKREIQEELQKDIIVGDPFAVFTYVNQVKGSHSIEVVYFAQFVGDISHITLDPINHSTAKWFTEADLDELNERDPDDLELLSLRKGFALLRGEPIQA